MGAGSSVAWAIPRSRTSSDAEPPPYSASTASAAEGNVSRVAVRGPRRKGKEEQGRGGEEAELQRNGAAELSWSMAR